MKVWDVFSFNDELDMLECRLVEAEGSPVCRHVLVEGGRDHRGNPKPLHYADNRERFAPWSDRIVHVIADVPESCPSPFEREAVQREQALPALADAAPDDVVLAADTDEILTAPVYAAVAGLPGAVTLVWMTCCYLFADLLWPVPWAGTVAVPYGRLRGLTRARRRGDVEEHVSGGFHLSWLGGPDAVAAKAGAHCHTEIHAEVLAAVERRDWRWAFRRWGDKPLVEADVDESWPRWVAGRQCPPSWFRPR